MTEITEVKITDETVEFRVPNAPRNLIHLRKGGRLHFVSPIRITEGIVLEGECLLLKSDAFITPYGIDMDMAVPHPNRLEEYYE